MSGITFSHKGDFSKTLRFLNHILRNDYLNVLEKYGHMGVVALQANTPKDTGLTADSWNYEIEENKKKGTITLRFTNSNVVDDWCNVAVMIQYGHATRSGTWVEGIDYINPSLGPIFEKLANEVWADIIDD